MTVALVQDHLVQRGGAERVLLSMARAFPGAPIHTGYWWREACFHEFERLDVRPLALDRVGVLRRHHRATLPLLPLAFSALRVDADITICGSSGWAAGCRTTGRKIVYHHSLARWLHEPGPYLARRGRTARLGLAALRRPLNAWDRRAVESTDAHYVYGSAMQTAVRQTFGIDAGILPPPVTIDALGPIEEVAGIEPGFWLCVCRLMPYKNVGQVAEAFVRLAGRRLVVAGEGPDRACLVAAAPANVTYLGAVGTPQMRWLYQQCQGVVSAAHEPYGLVPLEAATFGRPAVVLRAGGFCDTVVEGQTGAFFDRPEAQAIAAAVAGSAGTPYDPSVLRRHAAAWSEEAFIDRLRGIVDEQAITAGAVQDR